MSTAMSRLQYDIYLGSFLAHMVVKIATNFQETAFYTKI